MLTFVLGDCVHNVTASYSPAHLSVTDAVFKICWTKMTLQVAWFYELIDEVAVIQCTV